MDKAEKHGNNNIGLYDRPATFSNYKPIMAELIRFFGNCISPVLRSLSFPFRELVLRIRCWSKHLFVPNTTAPLSIKMCSTSNEVLSSRWREFAPSHVTGLMAEQFSNSHEPCLFLNLSYFAFRSSHMYAFWQQYKMQKDSFPFREIVQRIRCWSKHLFVAQRSSIPLFPMSIRY